MPCTGAQFEFVVADNIRRSGQHHRHAIDGKQWDACPSWTRDSARTSVTPESHRNERRSTSTGEGCDAPPLSVGPAVRIDRWKSPDHRAGRSKPWPPRSPAPNGAPRQCPGGWPDLRAHYAHRPERLCRQGDPGGERAFRPGSPHRWLPVRSVGVTRRRWRLPRHRTARGARSR
jgi:hypothetical protein